MLITTRRYTPLTGGCLAVLLLLSGCGDQEPAGAFDTDPRKVTERKITERAVSADAELAWSAELPEEHQVVEQATDVGDGVFVHFTAEHEDQDDPRTAAVYDDDGDLRWSVTHRDLFGARVSESGGQVFLERGDGLQAVSIRDGDEVWDLDDSGRVVDQRGDVLVLSKYDEADIYGFTQLVDASSGEEIAEVSGDPVAVGDDFVTVSDDDLVRQIALDGEELWTSDEPAGEPSGGELVTAAAGNGFVLVEDTRHEQDNVQRAYDPATGEQLWHVQGVWILGAGPDGTVLALDTNYDTRTRQDRPDELALFAASGETRRVAVGDLGQSTVDLGYVEVEGVGSVFVEPRAGRVFDASLDEVAFDEPVADLTVDGPYLMATSDVGEAATEFTLASWEGEATLTVQLDEPANGLWALDGGVLVQTLDDEIQLYR